MVLEERGELVRIDGLSYYSEFCGISKLVCLVVVLARMEHCTEGMMKYRLHWKARG
jgi:hypothetical protein